MARSQHIQSFDGAVPCENSHRNIAENYHCKDNPPHLQWPGGLWRDLRRGGKTVRDLLRDDGDGAFLDLQNGGRSETGAAHRKRPGAGRSPSWHCGGCVARANDGLGFPVTYREQP